MKRRIIKKLINKATIVAECKDINIMFGHDIYPYYGYYLVINKSNRKATSRTLIFTKYKIVNFIRNYRNKKMKYNNIQK